MYFFLKLKFLFKRPKVIIIIGQETEEIKKALFQVLRKHFRIGKEIFIFETEEKEIKKFFFFLKKSNFSVLVMNNLNKSFSTKNLPVNINTCFILNYDEEINDFDNLKTLKFGFREKSDIFVSDIRENENTNFKIRYKGSIVPFWFEKRLAKKEISVILSVISAGIELGLNLVEISQSFREK